MVLRNLVLICVRSQLFDHIRKVQRPVQSHNPASDHVESALIAFKVHLEFADVDVGNFRKRALEADRFFHIEFSDARHSSAEYLMFFQQALSGRLSPVN